MNKIIAFLFCSLPFLIHAQTFRPEDYGANVNDGKDDAEAFQKMFDDFPSDSRRVTVELQTGVYNILSTIYYPKYNDRTTLIIGNNATLKARGSEYDILVPGSTLPVGASSRKAKLLRGAYRDVAVNQALTDNDHLTIRDVRFEGGKTQLRMVSSYLSVVEQCQFVGGYRAIDGIFALQTTIRDCWINSFTGEGILLRSGESDAITGEPAWFTNATGSNSQSNICTISNCRVFANVPGTIGIRSYSSSNITVENTVIEGAVMKHAIHMDSRKSTTVVSVYLRNIHLEFGGDKSACESLIYLRGFATAELENIYSQFAAAPQVHAKDCARIFVTHWPYYPGGGFVTEYSGRWWFDNNWNMAAEDYRAPEFWNNGEIPWYVCHRENDAIFEVDHGFNNGLSSNGSEFGVSDDRIVTNVQSVLNTDIHELDKAIKLDDYDIIQVIPFGMVDVNGKVVTNYIPILKKKKGKKD